MLIFPAMKNMKNFALTFAFQRHSKGETKEHSSSVALKSILRHIIIHQGLPLVALNQKSMLLFMFLVEPRGEGK